MFRPNLYRTACAAIAGMAACMALPRAGSAEIVYATSINTDQILTVDSTTHVVTPVFNAGQQLDSLLFDPSGRIIYTELFNNQINAFNPTTHSNITLASPGGQPIDLALEPSLTTVLVSDSASHLDRVSLSGGLINSLTLGGRADGLIYDASGRLFVNVSSGFQNNDTQVEQIDPTTGAVIHTSGNLGVFLDGLTYDPFTGELFASDYNNGRILEINPLNLTIHTFFVPLGPALSQPDGIVSDGLGNLFIASRANSTVMEYNIVTNTDTAIGTINGLDDLAPASGLGAAPVPEPASIVLLGSGLIGFGVIRRRRRTS